MEIERAQAIAEVGKVIVESAKAEVAYIKATGEDGSGFIGSRAQTPGLPDTGAAAPRLVHGRAQSGSR